MKNFSNNSTFFIISLSWDEKEISQSFLNQYYLDYLFNYIQNEIKNMIHVKQELFEKYSEVVLCLFSSFFLKKKVLVVIKLFYDKENLISHEL